MAQADQSATLTWTASYEAYGRRTAETGSNQDKQRGNSKDEDPTGPLNEGFRYRDLETGVWLSRDPAGFVDGPNVYAYVMQNPWTSFDPDGLTRIEQNRVTRRDVIDPGQAPKRSQFAKGNTGDEEFHKAKSAHEAAEKTAKDNAQFNKEFSTLITAWENYDKIQEMTKSSPAMQAMNKSLDQETINIGGRQYNLVVNVTMDTSGNGGNTSAGKIEGNKYIVDLNLSRVQMSNPLTMTETTNYGQVGWHTVPHETYHAVETIGKGNSPGMRATDPLKLGTTRQGDGIQLNIPNTNTPVHEARAVRAANLVASQIGKTTFTTHYAPRGKEPFLPVPGYAPSP